jgi:hypothetical protein
MNFSDILNTYGRYISPENEALLRKSWNTLSSSARKAILSGLRQIQEKEVTLLSKAFDAEPNLHGAIQQHISRQRVESLHEIERNNS